MHIVQVPTYYAFHGPSMVVGSSLSPPPPVSTRGRVSPARRRLFDAAAEGDAQELENRRAVERQMAQMQLEKSRRWNFDFQNEIPLNGRYQWQLPTLPADRPSHPLPPPAGIKRPIDNQVESAAAPLRKQMKNDLHNINNNQTKITDFMKNQKLKDNNKRLDNESSSTTNNGIIDH